jgi:hypothetical protein
MSWEVIQDEDAINIQYENITLVRLMAMSNYFQQLS